MLSRALRSAVMSRQADNVSSISFIASTGVNVKTITYPSAASGAQAGDLLIVYYNSATDAVATPPSLSFAGSGLTQLASYNEYATAAADAGNIYIGYKILTSADLGSTFTPTTAGPYYVWSCSVFRLNNKSLTSVTSGSVTTNGNAGTIATPSAQTITSSSGTAPLIALGFYSIEGGGNASASTMSPTQTGSVIQFTSHVLRYKIYNSSPQNVTCTYSSTGGTARGMASMYLSLS